MRLKKITLSNYRCFEHLEIDLRPKLTIIVGDNGNGKTSILDAIAIGISPFIGAFDQGKKKDIHVDDVRMTMDLMGQISFNHPTRIEINGDFGDQNQTWARVRKSQKGRSTINEAQNLIAYGKNLQPFSQVPGFTQFPVIRYYGVCRLCKEIKSAIPKKTPRKYAESDAGYIDCLESASSFDVFQMWFIATTHAIFEYEQALADKQEWDEGRKIAGEHWKTLNTTVRQTLNRALQSSGWQDIKYDATLQKLVMFHKQQGMLGVDQLSSGIRTMVGLVADLAYRAVKLNPHLKQNAVLNAEGIVLIDEIDLHLHPSWQQHVLQDLQAAFPKLQFIVTTHSPQVLSTVHRDCIRLLGKNCNGQLVASKPDAESYGEMSSDVLESVMQVNPMPPVPEKVDLDRLTALVDQGLYDEWEAQNLLERLRGVFGNSHPHIQKMLRSIQRQKALKS